MTQLFQLFDAIRPLSAPLKDYISSVLQRKEVEKKGIILMPGQVNRYIYFIEKGLVRSYKDVNGKERTTWFMREGDIFIAVESFFTQTESNQTIEAMEDCIFRCIHFDQLEYAYEYHPEFNFHGRKILQYYYKLSEDRNHMREKPGPERYEYLMNDQPWLVNRVMDKHLASYLAMEPETFSKEKSKYAGRGGQK